MTSRHFQFKTKINGEPYEDYTLCKTRAEATDIFLKFLRQQGSKITYLEVFKNTKPVGQRPNKNLL